MRNGEDRITRSRARALIISTTVLMLIYFLKVFYLAVVQHKKYETLAIKNVTREIIIPHPRGLILDSRKKVLVDNRSEFLIVIDERDAYNPQLPQTLAWLRENIDTNIVSDIDYIRRQIKYSKSKRFVLRKKLSLDEVIKIKEHKRALPGIRIDERLVRHYIYGEEFAHIIGHVGEISREQLRKLKDRGYKKGDFIGQTGLEWAYEQYLRGEDGKRILKVDVHGNYLSTVDIKKPRPGNNIVMTIDKRLQDVAYKALKGKRGAVIALDPRNGKILVYASSPQFDPNMFSYGISAEDWNKLVNDTGNPLLDRVALTHVAPGSTFKVVTGIAALKSRYMALDTIINCTGSMEVGSETFMCWKRDGHGELNFLDAVAQSCDIYFYNAGILAGIDMIDSVAYLLGLGQKPIIKLKDVAAGLVPSPEWLRKTRRVSWSRGYTINTSIGQGDIQVSPLQMAILMMIVANEGTYYMPQYVEQIYDYTGDTVWQFEPKVVREVPIEREYFRDLKLGMYYAVNKIHGTAWWTARIKGFDVFGKTGTAQVVRQQDELEKQDWGSFRPHAWFIAGAPYRDPKIVIAVFVENGGHGATGAAPIARKVLYEYYKILKMEKKQNV